MMISPYAEQGNLRKYLGSCGWDRAETCNRLIDVAKGAIFLYKSGIACHGDLKPDNILVSRGVAKIADLGLSMDFDDLQRTTMRGGHAGTWGYIAPEILDGSWRNKNVPFDGERADVYAFAMIMYECFSHGSRPVIGVFNHQVNNFLVRKILLLSKPRSFAGPHRNRFAQASS